MFLQVSNTFSRKNTLNIDPASISWNRVVDLNDSALTNINIGAKSKKTFAPT